MLLYCDIIKEEDLRLREKSKTVQLPLSDEDIKTIEVLNDYLINGYDEKMVEEHDIRPGVGIAAPQIGVLKQIFLILASDEKGNIYHCAFINPKITSHSEELTFLPTGEGCLSVEREVNGLIHRPRRITVSAYLYDFEKKTAYKEQIKLKDYIAIVFQHEYDHLHGILFVDHIDQINPFHVPYNSQPVLFLNLSEQDEE